MTFSPTRAAQVAAIAMIVTVVTQILYITLPDLGVAVDRDVVWSLEVLSFIVISVAGLALVAARPLIGAAIAIFGIFNTIQAGSGLVMFGPLIEGGEALAPVFSAVLAMAFLLYHAAKVALAFGAIGAGLLLNGSTTGLTRLVAIAAALAGLAALVLNAAAIATDADLMFAAGGAGTAATLLLALVLKQAVTTQAD